MIETETMDKLNDTLYGLPSTAQAPFGGLKESGFGREGGHQGMEEYLDTKYVSLGGISKRP